MTVLIHWSYITSFWLYCLSFLFSFLSYRLELLSATLALLANGASLVLIGVQTGHPPVFNLFETLVVSSFFLGLFGIFGKSAPETAPSVRTWVWITATLMLGVLFYFPRVPAPFRYDYDYLPIVLFHAARDLSLACVLYSSAHFLQSRLRGNSGARYNAHLHDGRNYLLLGSTFFLLSEFVGIIWCQNGWGDVWRWNTAFFQSTLIVLYFMLVFHLPGRGRQLENITGAVGGLNGFFMLTLTVVRGLA